MLFRCFHPSVCPVCCILLPGSVVLCYGEINLWFLVCGNCRLLQSFTSGMPVVLVWLSHEATRVLFVAIIC